MSTSVDTQAETASGNGKDAGPLLQKGMMERASH